MGILDAPGLRAATGDVRHVVGVKASKTFSTSSGTSEAGIGAVVPFADKLYFINYPDENNNGAGLGLWVMDESLQPTLIAETNVTSAARATLNNRLFIGVHAIDSNGTVTPITGIPVDERPAGYAKLPGSSFLWAWMMSGTLYKIDPATLVASIATNGVGSAAGNLNIVGQPHGKAIWGHPAGRYLFMTLNRENPDGRLAVFDTQTSTWTDIDTGHNSWIEVSGSYDGNGHIYATGHDGLSGLLWMFNGVTYSPTPKKFRIPLATDQMRFGWQQEWMRIRAVETERYLMDLHGCFYQLSSVISNGDTFATGLPRLEAIARHLRTVPDFCSWNGYFVLTGNQATPQSGNKYTNTGQPQSGLLLTTLDDIWSWGKPTGSGFWYKNASVTAGTQSDLMLARGYGSNKEVHLVNGTGTAVDVDIRCQMNETTSAYTYTTVTVPANGHAGVILPGCDWTAVRPVTACTDLTAWVVYS